MKEPRPLLDDYVRNGSEAAFRELVARYLDLVYSTALRSVNGNNAMAEDVAQTVFVDLARMAKSLSSEVKLGGWLHRHTCFVAANAIRAERRRQSRERQAVEMNDLSDSSAHRLDEVAPILDDAINQLAASDRTAIVLRFYEKLDFRAVGAAMGTNEAAAQKRVSRAVEKLHALLHRRGVTLSLVALGTVLAGEAVKAAPTGLAASISGTALSAAAAGSGKTIALLKLMAATKLQTGLVTLIVIASVLAPLILEHSVQARLRQQGELISQNDNEIAQLKAQVQNANLHRETVADPPTAENSQFREVLRMRGEVARLRDAVAKMSAATAPKPASAEEQIAAIKAVYAARVEKLKQWFEDHPNQKTPEMKSMREGAWLDATEGLDSDDDLPRVASNLRGNAEPRGILGLALRKYVLANNGQYPTDLAPLQPYFKTPIDDAVLQRFEIVPSASLVDELQTGDPWIITEVAPVDPDMDIRSAQGATNGRSVGPNITNRWRTRPVR